MKRFVLIILFFFVFLAPAFAKDFETTVSAVGVYYPNLPPNLPLDFYDIELLVKNNGKILIPFKQISELFEIKPVTNHSTHDITFEYHNKKGKISANGIIFDGKKISNKQNIYLKKGLMAEVQDEIFCSAEDLEKIFNTRIETDENNLSISVFLDNQIPDITPAKNLLQEDFKIRTFQNVYTPDKNRIFELNSIGLNNNTLSDSISQYMMGQSQKNVFFNNNTNILLGGKAYNGDYTIDMNTYNYKGELFSFGGFGFNYKNKFKNFEYEIGKPNGIIEKNYSLGTQLMGAQIRNYSSKKEDYRDLDGYVDKTSLVKVFFDDEEVKTLSTYDGYYSLKEIFVNKKPKKIKIVELKSDKSEKIILEKTFTNPDELKKGEKHYDLILGASGYNNRLFTQNNYIYELNTKKAVAGIQYQYGIRDNIKLDSKLFLDKIYYRPQNSIWQSFYTPDALLTSGTWKNPNNLDGITNFNTIYFQKDSSLSYKLSGGISSAKDLTSGGKQFFGYAVSAGGKLKRKLGNIEAELFNTSPDFYFAGSNGSYINDRLGGGISFDISKSGINAYGRYKKYFSNTNHKFEGGLLDFNDYNLGISKNFEKFANIKFNITGRDGQNSRAENKSYYYDFNLSKQLTSKLYLEAGKNASNYQTNYKQVYNGLNGFNSLYSTIYAKADYKLPKNTGKISLGHDIIKYDYSGSKNEYNMAKIGYTFPSFKNLTLSVGTGYKYTGNDNGFDFNANLAIRTKSGRTININYQYNRTGGFIINNMFIPTSNRHSINIVLNDVWAILPNSIQSVGFNNPNRGFVDIVAYIDKNNNGKFDKEDVRVGNVPIKCNWMNENIYTNRRGRVSPSGIDSGVYNVKIDNDKLAATLIDYENKTKMVRVEGGKTTRVEFPLKSCIGNISGKVSVTDDFARRMDTKDFVVVLLDDKGEEKAYSTLDNNSEFYLSGIEPGVYFVQLDKNIIEENNLQNIENKSTIKVEIPYEYKHFTEIKDINLFYNVISI